MGFHAIKTFPVHGSFHLLKSLQINRASLWAKNAEKTTHCRSLWK
jgi:hypothetical protein